MRTSEEFYREWESLLATVDDDAKAYLNRELYSVRHRWVSVWTDLYTTFGARSTQRVESVNAQLKRLLHHGSERPLPELFKVLNDIYDTQERRRIAQLTAEKHTNHRVDGPVYTAAREHVTRYAAERVHQEASYVTEYFALFFPSLPPGVTVDPMAPSAVRTAYIPPTQLLRDHGALSTSLGHTLDVDYTSFSHTKDVQLPYLSHAAYSGGSDDAGAWFVRSKVATSGTRTHWVVLQEDGPAVCTDCPWSNNWLLPCRHILAANNAFWRDQPIFRRSQCHPRWLLDVSSTTATATSSSSALTDTDNALASSWDADGDDPAEMQMSSNELYLDWMAKCARVGNFIKPHGERGLALASRKLEEIINELRAADGTAVLAQVSAPSSRSLHAHSCSVAILCLFTPCSPVSLSPDPTLPRSVLFTYPRHISDTPGTCQSHTLHVPVSYL